MVPFKIVRLYRTLFISFLFLWITAKGYTNNSTEGIETKFRQETAFLDSITPNEEVEKAFSLWNEVVTKRKFIDRLDQLSTIDLPVGICATKGKEGEKYSIIISDLIVRDGEAFLNAYLAFEVPGTNKKIAFKGVNIPFSHKGGIKGVAQLFLVDDFPIPLGNNATIHLKGRGLTTAAWDCSGFKEMAITADVEFNNDIFIPENEDGSRNYGATLTASFQTVVNDWNNLMVGISLQPFQIKSAEGLGFKVTNAVFDMSDFANPIGVAFPLEYSTNYFSGMDPTIWRGIYIQEAEVRLPSQFKKRESTERMKVYAQNLLIDDFGFSGFVGVENLLTLEEGDMNGWNFSVQDLNIEFQASKIKSGAFSGEIDIPQFENGSQFDYAAIIGPDDKYFFSVEMANNIKMPIWAAELEIYPNSSITIESIDKKFVPSLWLNGKMSINPSLNKDDPESKKLSIANLEFQGMQIQTVKPYFSIDYISFGSDQNKFSNFPVSIYKIGFIGNEDKIGLQLGLTVNLMEEGKGGFGGDGFFTVWGKQGQNNWEFDHLQVDKIFVDISKPGAFELAGEIGFIRGDSTYGEGFKGMLTADFAGFGMEATALFGNVKGFRYWYADALMTSPTGIPAGPISLNGFGGGAFNHVRQASLDDNNVSEIGLTRSGLIYVPDVKSGLGIIASVKFGLTGSSDAMNGDARFGISFTTSGGINQIFFDGNAYFMTPPGPVGSSEIAQSAKERIGNDKNIPFDRNRAQLYGNIFMLMDFPNKSFHAAFSIYINAAGGLIKGVNEGGLAGWGMVHFEPSDWYIYLGTPDKPNGISILGIAKMTNYFMAGKSIPELPPPPQKVLSILNKRGKYAESINSTTLGDGKGFALGAAFVFDTGERKFLIFYGRFGCGIGFDILLKNYGSNTFCEGRDKAIGINGWYAQGQAYAWIAAEVGIIIRLPFHKGKYSILEMEVAALLQTKAPNPFWMKGNVGGRYKILNGLVKGHCDFEFEIGEQCKVVSSSPFEGVPVIADIKPVENEENVSVFTTPQFIFNMPVDEEFEFQTEQKLTKKFRINLREYSIKASSGEIINGTLQWNDDKKVAVFKSKDILPGETDVIVQASVSFEEFKYGNWYEVKVNGKTAIESKSAKFRTGKEPDHISEENVAFSYPVNKQFNYYRSESTSNYIDLEMGQPKLFNPGSEWKQYAKITPVKSGYPIYLSYTYNSADSKINFSLPNNLSFNTVYKFELVNVPSVAAENIDINVQQRIEKLQVATETNSTDIEVETQFAVDSRTELQEKVIYSSYFRTSRYETFGDKLKNLTYSEGISWEIQPLVHSLTVNIEGERFDSHEVVNLQDKKLIEVVPVLEETKWFLEKMKPLFDLDENTLKSINVNGFKMPSLTSYLFQSDGTRSLTDEEIETGTINNSEVLSGMKYYLAKYSIEYLYTLKNHISNKYILKPVYDPKLQAILNTRFYPLTYGDYPVDIKYRLPGNEEPNSKHKHIIRYNN